MSDSVPLIDPPPKKAVASAPAPAQCAIAGSASQVFKKGALLFAVFIFLMSDESVHSLMPAIGVNTSGGIRPSGRLIQALLLVIIYAALSSAVDSNWL